MPFRQRDVFNPASIGGFHAIESIQDVGEDGRGLVHLFDPSVESLPDMEMFDLEALVRAKVPLDKTNTKVLSGDALLVADALSDFEDENNNFNTEVNHEQ